MEKLKPITEKTQFTDAYHYTQSAIDAFSDVSPNIPKVMLVIVQNIYGRFDEAAHGLYVAANSYDTDEKIKYLEIAQRELFYQFSSIESIVRGKGLTVGAANEVLDKIHIAHENTARWLNSLKAWD